MIMTTDDRKLTLARTQRRPSKQHHLQIRDVAVQLVQSAQYFITTYFIIPIYFHHTCPNSHLHGLQTNETISVTHTD